MTPNSSGKTKATLLLGALLLIGAGCAKQPAANVDISLNVNQQGSPVINTNANANVNVPDDTAMVAVKKFTATLASQSSSGQTGTVVITETGGKSRVVIAIQGQPAGSSEPAHIHLGTCPAPGEVKWALSNVEEGKSETTIGATLAELVAAGDIAVNVHKSATEISTYVACGNLRADVDNEAGRMPDDILNGNDNVDGGAGGRADDKTVSGDELTPPQNVKVTAREIKVTARQFEFVPSEIRVKVGEKIKLTLTNEDVKHSIAIPAIGLDLEAPAKGTASEEFTADKPGTFPFICDTYCGNGHRGMKGTLIVE